LFSVGSSGSATSGVVGDGGEEREGGGGAVGVFERLGSGLFEALFGAEAE